jgi:4-diphosphocytidyl-2-C-methyl-D-erythritol kinase
MIVFPNAKINIGLNVTSKRPDNFHNLESIFYPINWVDILEINKSETFEFTSSGLAINTNLDNNLVVKAYRLMVEKFNISPCKIHLHKQIPMGAGLGGGSADASFTLTAINSLFNLNISVKVLVELADTLGSDCPFFIENTPKFITEKGNKMSEIDLDLSGYYIKLLNPNIHISTKEAFNGIKPKLSSVNYLEISIDDLEINKITNDFENSVFPIHPILKDLKSKLKTENAFYTSMTGTGSTIYGLFKNKPESTSKAYTEKIIKL